MASATGLGPVGRGFKSLCPERSEGAERPACAGRVGICSENRCFCISKNRFEPVPKEARAALARPEEKSSAPNEIRGKRPKNFGRERDLKCSAMFLPQQKPRQPVPKGAGAALARPEEKSSAPIEERGRETRLRGSREGFEVQHDVFASAKTV